MADATCPQCDGAVQRRKKSGPPPTYCSQQCRRDAYAARCRADGRYAAMLADRVARREPSIHRLTCRTCSAEFESKQRATAFCGKRCQEAGNTRGCGREGCPRPHRAKGLCNRHYKDERYPDARFSFPDDPDAKRKRDLIKAKRRRAAQRRSDAEDVDRDLVGDRDGWSCGICHHEVDRRRVYPDPKSPSLDHVVPLSRGGKHTYANTRISHLRCNVMRNNRVEAESPAPM